ncbi:MAG: metal-dependent transcriptional regulator [Dehalococcoidia bacterium]|nr:metal-dependent transcriptional regulator [Dehalococcoidia bacterium]
MPRKGGLLIKERTEAPHERVSHVAENYLLSLYLIQEEGRRPTIAQLADHIRHLPPTELLGTSLPTVAGMLRRMAREQLVTLNAKKEIELTPRGQVLAEGMVRRHRLAERMAVDILGLDLHQAHIEAHRLEHAISPDLERLIAKRLGNPTTCPFGWPIPGSNYKPPPGKTLTLDQAAKGGRYIVARVPEEDQELLRFLIEHRVLPEEELRIVETGQFRGVLVFSNAAGESALGYQAAARVWVREAGPLAHTSFN